MDIDLSRRFAFSTHTFAALLITYGNLMGLYYSIWTVSLFCIVRSVHVVIIDCLSYGDFTTKQEKLGHAHSYWNI